MKFPQWFIRWVKRFIEVRQVLEVPKDKTDFEKFKEAVGVISNPGGSLQDYCKNFKDLFDKCMVRKVRLFDNGLMTESGVKFEDPVTGESTNSRIARASWLKWDGNKWGRLDLKGGEVMRESFRQMTVDSDEWQKQSDSFDTPTSNLNMAALNSSTVTNKNLPYPPGPFTRQMYLPDIWKMMALSFQMYNYSGLAKRAIDIKADFVIGPGIKINCDDDNLQKAMDDFMDRTNFNTKLWRWAMMGYVNGELFVHPVIDNQGKLHIRSVDPATIWDIVTNPSDIEEVHGYHVQYPTQYQLFTKGTDGTEFPTTEYILDLMPAESLIHLKWNVQENEKRGRSDLLSGLPILSYNDDFIRAKVLRAIQEASWVWDVELTEGDQTDVDRESQKETNYTQPGSSYFHTSGIKRKLEGFAGAASTGISGIGEEIINQFALAVGTPKDFLGTAGHSNRASALTATEPFTKHIQTRQHEMEWLIRRLVNIQADALGIPDPKFEVIFPEITPADMLQKVQALAICQTSKWFAPETCAIMAAAELNNTSFDWDEEKAKIDENDAHDALTNALYKPGQPTSGPGGAPTTPKLPGSGMGIPPKAQGGLSGGEKSQVTDALTTL